MGSVKTIPATLGPSVTLSPWNQWLPVMRWPLPFRTIVVPKRWNRLARIFASLAFTLKARLTRAVRRHLLFVRDEMAAVDLKVLAADPVRG